MQGMQRDTVRRRQRGAMVDTVSPSHRPIISVSRRFNDTDVDALYDGIVRPATERQGLPLECHFAADSVESPDFWINRMGVIQDISDIHLIIDIKRSGPTLYETHYSNLSCAYGRTDFLALNFDCHPIYIHRKFRIIVHDQPRYLPCSASYSIRPLRPAMSSTPPRGNDLLVRYQAGNPEGFAAALNDALAIAVLAVEKQAAFLDNLGSAKLVAKAKYVSPLSLSRGALMLSPARFRQVCAKIATRLAGGGGVGGIVEDIVEASGRPRSGSPPWPPRRRQRVVAAYNGLLNDLVETSRALIADPSNETACRRYAVLAQTLELVGPVDGSFAEEAAGIRDRLDTGNWLFRLITGLQARYVRHVMASALGPRANA